jgi:hypothetical protein
VPKPLVRPVRSIPPLSVVMAAIMSDLVTVRQCEAV